MPEISRNRQNARYAEELGVQLSLDSESSLVNSGLKGNLKSSILLSDGVYTVNCHKGGDNWLEVKLTNSGTVSAGVDSPWKVTNQKLFVSAGWLTAKDGTTTGTWSTFTSGDPNVYPGHQVLQASHSAAQRRYISWGDTFGGDLYLMFTGDTDGGQCTVSVDKTTSTVSGITQANPAVVTDNAHPYSDGDLIRIDDVVGMTEVNGKVFTVANSTTNTYELSGVDSSAYTAYTSGGESGSVTAVVDTYNASANTWRESALVTRNLDSQARTVVVETLLDANASSSGTQLNITTLRVENGSIAPYSPLFQPKSWVSNSPVRAYEEVQAPNGNFYYTTSAGTTGSTAPTHTSGSVSDGGVTWTFMNGTSFSSKSTVIQVNGSELEYAYEVDYLGGGKQDVGGNLHGNEFVSSLKVLVNQEEQTVSEGEFYIGDMITLQQSIVDFYGASYASKTDIANVYQVHEFDSSSMRVKLDFDWLVTANIGWFYSAMWPILPYASSGYTKNFTRMQTPRVSYSFSDYEGTVTSILGNQKDYWMQADGRAYVERGASGVPSSDNGTIGLSVALKVDASKMNLYGDSDENNAGLAMNLNSGSYTGFSSWLAKMYFQRVASDQPLEVTTTTPISACNTYYCVLTDNNIDVSSL